MPLLEGAESPSNTVWPGLRPTSVPSGILIHLFGTIHRGRTDSLRQDRQQSDSIGQTVLQTIAQKLQFIQTVNCNGSKTAKIIKR